jgi:hypothetical protein
VRALSQPASIHAAGRKRQPPAEFAKVADASPRSGRVGIFATLMKIGLNTLNPAHDRLAPERARSHVS